VEDRLPEFGAVVIGRNEGERLELCLTSLHAARFVVYVDSGSTDRSVQRARDHGAEVVELETTIPFTAARARNAGFRRLKEVAPKLQFVQFIDGDCELNQDWPGRAVDHLTAHLEVAAVCGRRRERFPDRSIYNQLCDLEWDGPPGQSKAFGGDVLIRTKALEAVGGYRGDLIAGEEPELAVRLRQKGWSIWRLPAEMTLHDAAMTRLSQWWRRTVRSGYAFAHGAYLHGAPPERHWVWESRRALLWGLGLPLFCLALALIFWPYGLLAFLIYPAQIARQIGRNTGPLENRVLLAVFQTLSRFPEAVGQLKFFRDWVFGRRSSILEYK
jgi:glycosyltransferase involved in cell wall biosynthesis